MRYLIAICLCFPLVIHAGTDIPLKMSDNFFNALQSGKTKDAYSALLKNSYILRDQPQALTGLTGQTHNEFEMNGQMLGFELVKRTAFGESLDRLTYVVMLEKVPTVWELYFYKPKGEWYLTGIKFTQQLDALP